MSHPLDGAWEKLRWADLHTQRLQREITAFEAGHEPPVSVLTKVNKQDKTLVVYISRVAHLPSDWALIIGDAIHNFRCCLDYLVWTLSLLSTDGVDPPEAESISFPIASHDGTTRGGFRTNTNQKRIRLLSPLARAFIESVQPYSGMKGAEYLAILQELSNSDKHRLLQPALVAPKEWTTKWRVKGADCHMDEMRPSLAYSLTERPVEVGTEYLTVPLILTGPKPQVDVHINLTPYVAFRNGAPVEETLDGIGDYVATVLDASEILWEEDPAKTAELPRLIEEAHRVPPKAGKKLWVHRAIDLEGNEWGVLNESETGNLPPGLERIKDSEPPTESEPPPS